MKIDFFQLDLGGKIMASKIEIYKTNILKSRKNFCKKFPKDEANKILEYLHLSSLGKINRGKAD